MAEEVQVGDKTYTIAPFRGFKFTRAGRIISRLSEEWPKVLNKVNEFTRDYEKNNRLVITRDMIDSPRFAPLGLTVEMFEDKAYVEIPQPPSDVEQFMAVLPEIMELAEREVLQLLALIIAPNSDLRKADQDQQVDQYLDSLGKDLLYEGEIQELGDIVVAGWEVMQGQFEGKEKLLRLARAYFRRGQEQQKKQEEEERKLRSLQPSSEDSAPSIPDGPETTFSSESNGQSSEPTSDSSDEPSKEPEPEPIPGS